MWDDPRVVLRVTESGGRVRFEVRVVPRASRDAIVGEHAGALKVALTAPPVEGAANAALVALLGASLGVPKRAVTLVRGDTARQKTIEVAGSSAEAVRALVPPTG